MNGKNVSDPSPEDTSEEFDAFDDDSFLDNVTGDIDPEDYQEQEDDGCEGGACKI